MVQRRTFLRLASLHGTAASLALWNLSRTPFVRAAPPQPVARVIVEPLASDSEDLPSYIVRVAGKWDATLYKRLLGAANDFKEGDEIVGVAAADPTSRERARKLIGNTTLAWLDSQPLLRDSLDALIRPSDKQALAAQPQLVTFADLKRFLLEASEEQIHAIKATLSSEVIGCLVKLMSNPELIAVSSKVFNPLPGSRIGAKGYLGARIQPNSPTDNVDDIRWQVFDGFAYAVGDVLLGTNPVSSNPASVAAIEKTLADVLTTFGIDDAMPHCVLAHIDIQAEVERSEPGSTALWFQSIAGSDTANATFDISVDKMVAHARQRAGKFGLYFETGQGADFTNGHAHGFDMVLHESRKYGFARALAREVQQARGSEAVWNHTNDVAGFIGPEVFRTKEQLVRCCLEDLVMGKLHGLTIGLDVCATLHMDISPADLDWCLEKIAPAAPAYLMALPTKIDPMLGYLTTGFQDHVRLREEFGFRVNDRMWNFFQEIEVIDALGRPTEHFGDPTWVYLQYRRRKQDQRPDTEILADGRATLGQIRERGVFIAEGYGSRPSRLSPKLEREIQHIYDDAKRCIWLEWDRDFVAQIPGALPLSTQSKNREDYILHPASGEVLSEASLEAIKQLRDKHGGAYDVQILVSEGLNAAAAMDAGNLLPLLEAIHRTCQEIGLKAAPETCVITAGRVRAGYKIGETLFGGAAGKRSILHIVGERPGSGHHTLSVYITQAHGLDWLVPGRIDHDRTQVVSGISVTALSPASAAVEVDRILRALHA